MTSTASSVAPPGRSPHSPSFRWAPNSASASHPDDRRAVRDIARVRLLDEILGFFGGRALPMMTQFVEAGKLTMDDIRALEKALKKRGRK
jgi:hypothetical protein